MPYSKQFQKPYIVVDFSIDDPEEIIHRATIEGATYMYGEDLTYILDAQRGVGPELYTVSAIHRSGKTYLAEVTQCIKPNGAQKHGHINLPIKSESAYQELKRRGYTIIAEVIPGGHVHVHVCIDTGEEDVKSIVIPNGPDITYEISEMLVEWYLEQ